MTALLEYVEIFVQVLHTKIILQLQRKKEQITVVTELVV